jgi:hypothetical protein
MPEHNLLGEYKGVVKILMTKYDEKPIDEECILPYVSAILHETNTMKNVNAIMNDLGSVHGDYKCVRDPTDPNGLYKIYKIEPGMFYNGKEIVARFWFDTVNETIKPLEFVNIK